MTASVSAETHTVLANNTSFSPSALEVAPGDTVIWQYTSGWMGHTVTSGMNCIADGMFFDASVNNGSPTFEWVVPDYASVDIPYFCKPHCGMGMTGVISINADGATLQVPGDYLTIAEAIDAAVAGDIINIAAGTYYEADLVVGAANITLRGEANADGTPAVTIDAQQQGRVFEMVDVTHPPPGIPGLVVFDTMVITGGSVSGNGGGVSITTCSPVFRNCTITQNSCTGNGGGVYVYHQAEGAPWARADVKFIGCTIIGNDAQDGGGMFSKSNEYNYGAQPSLFGCVVNENTASNGVGGIRHATWPTISCVNLYSHQLLKKKIDVVGGYHQVPDGPGLGVEVDERAIAKYRVPEKTMQKLNGAVYDRPKPRIINSIVYPDGSCVHMASASQGYGFFSAGHGPAQAEGTRLEPWPDDGSKDWKKLFERAQVRPVRDRWKKR